MNLQQIQLILEIARTGSLSKAANNLFISQPNASNSIKALEHEIGFQIFRRSSTGMVLTEKGEKTIKNAEMVQHYVNNIMKIQNQSDLVRHFHLGVVPYTILRKAFERLIIDYQDKGILDFSCRSYEYPHAVESLCALKLDLYALLYDRKQEKEIQEDLSDYPLKLTTLGEIKMHINFRRGHPAIGDGLPDFALLANYPYVDYVSNSLAEFTNRHLDKNFKIPYKYRLCVEHQELRCSIVGKTDAFSTGFQPSEDLLERHNLVTFPLPLPAMKIGIITRANEEPSEECNYYVLILKEILRAME